MIRITSAWARRAANLNHPHVGLPFTASFTTRTRLSLALMTRTVEFHTSQPAINLPSEDRRLLLSNLHISISFESTPIQLSTLTLNLRTKASSWQPRARRALPKFWLWRASQKSYRAVPWRSFHCKLWEERRGFNRIFVFTCDDGKCVVARLPTRVPGPRRLTTY